MSDQHNAAIIIATGNIVAGVVQALLGSNQHNEAEAAIKKYVPIAMQALVDNAKVKLPK